MGRFVNTPGPRRGTGAGVPSRSTSSPVPRRGASSSTFDPRVPPPGQQLGQQQHHARVATEPPEYDSEEEEDNLYDVRRFLREDDVSSIDEEEDEDDVSSTSTHRNLFLGGGISADQLLALPHGVPRRGEAGEQPNRTNIRVRPERGIESVLVPGAERRLGPGETTSEDEVRHVHWQRSHLQR